MKKKSYTSKLKPRRNEIADKQHFTEIIAAMKNSLALRRLAKCSKVDSLAVGYSLAANILIRVLAFDKKNFAVLPAATLEILTQDAARRKELGTPTPTPRVLKMPRRQEGNESA